MSAHVKPVYQGKIVQLGIESITMPNGVSVELEIVRHPGGAAVVALDEREQVCLLRQYRHAAGGWLWELPAGKLEGDEPAETTAKRELLEEAGLEATSWKKLGNIIPTPGICDEVIHLYLARQLTARAAQPEAHELFEIHWVPFSAALGQVYDGTIVDAKTMLGLTLAAKTVR
ncbi:MAG: NUDIX hydrolase [Gammaproteobacteria bacterium]|jgi:ADP-ribose pyrophosphatase